MKRLQQQIAEKDQFKRGWRLFCALIMSKGSCVVLHSSLTETVYQSNIEILSNFVQIRRMKNIVCLGKTAPLAVFVDAEQCG